MSTEEGTGIVHIAPAFGEDDLNLGNKENLPFVQHIKTDGSLRLELCSSLFDGGNNPAQWRVQLKEVDIGVLKYLQKHEVLFKKENVKHSYPHCWRCDTPLLNYATSSWFVKIDDDFKKRLLAINDKINWVPDHLKDGRFGKWLEGARDWAISRSRYWGAPLPVWRCQKCNKIKVIGNVAQLQKELKSQNLKLNDLHRPYIDKIVLTCDKCGGQTMRISEVFDCWFESGSMPYASEIIFSDFELTSQTTRQDILSHIKFPADFIAEGIDQTRGWFYTLLVLGVGLYNQSPFKNVVVNGIILAEDGQKMSKRLKNYPDPNDIINKYGADALRFYLLSSPAVRGESLNFSEKGVDEVYKKVVLLVLNVLKFWETYSDNFQFSINFQSIFKSQFSIFKHILDQWILARLGQLISDVGKSLDNYEIDWACRSIAAFIDDLSTWYLRRSRERFKSQKSKVKSQICKLKGKSGVSDDPVFVLGYVLLELSKVMAPICPFLAEHIYQNVKCQNPNAKSMSNVKIQMPNQRRESVHLEEWPKINSKFKIQNSKSLLENMQKVREVCEIGHSLRAEAGVKVRQALRQLKIKNEKLKITIQNLKLSQKEITAYSLQLTALIADELNVKEVEMVDKLPQDNGWVSKDGAALYTVVDDELREEGIIRELTRQINNLRKKQELTIDDRIVLEYATESEELRQIIDKYREELIRAVLAREINYQKSLEGERLKVEWSDIIVRLGN